MSMQANGKFHKSVDLSAADFAEDFDILWIQGTGNLTIVDYADVSVTITVPNNHWHVAGGKKIVRATTTATNITAYKYSQSF